MNPPALAKANPMMQWLRSPLVMSLALSMLPVASTLAASPEKPDYLRDIRPILSKNCFACHGADDQQRKAGLRLDRRDSGTAELKSGNVAILPGDSEGSELIIRITSDDKSLRMPPPKSGDALKAEEVAAVRKWIDQGATYAEHWAYVPPLRRPPPKVNRSDWVRTPIDGWILASLDQAGLTPNEESDRLVLLRRASLDLRGLPPSAEEVAQFASDTAPDAYERAVDRLLADPAYGERWARMWLDLARYADSAGYGSDPLRTIWRYRDWVIQAWNHNQPYDQFTLDQLAGDLRADSTQDQRIATAFHRNTMTNTEGGTDDEEFRVAAIKDRVDSTLQVWMGLTMGCAKCHTHKYDPITQTEYYQFYAIFNQTADSDKPDESPTIPAPTADIQDRIDSINRQITGLRQSLDVGTPELAKAQAAWESELRGEPAWTVLKPVSAAASAGSTLTTEPDGSVLASGKPPASESYTLVLKPPTKAVTALRLEVIPDAGLPGKGSGRAGNGNFVLSRFRALVRPSGKDDAPALGKFVRVELSGEGKILSLAEVEVQSGGRNVARKGKATQSSVDYEGAPELAIDGNTNGHYFDAKSTTHTRISTTPYWELALEQPTAIESITVWNRTDGAGERLAGAKVQVLDAERKLLWESELSSPPSPKTELKPDRRRSVSIAQAAADFAQDGFPARDALKPADPGKNGWAVGPRTDQPHAATFLLQEPLTLADGEELVLVLDQTYGEMPGHLLGKFRLSATTDARLSKRLKAPEQILAIVDRPTDQRSSAQSETLAKHYRSIAPGLQSIRDQIARLEKSRPEIPTVPVLKELTGDQKRVTKLLNKGNFLDPGPEVKPGVLSAFHQLPEGSNADRMGVARWLTAPKNPLTARVAVNRLWAQLFGVGLVETEEDFGMQGDLPSHPELLDWLATEYTRLDWDTKKLLRLIVTSATYRQSSKVSPEKLAKDPRNRLLARGPRFRLEAEMVRDQALALSGLLSRKLAGPSVFPPQPAGLWQAAFNGQRTWSTSQGLDQHRRGLYTFWRRTIPYPSMATFDAPSREICSIRRSRTNTPLQAFVTMNDPVYVEASQALARRIAAEGGSTAEDRARHGLTLCLCRPPRPEMVAKVVELYEAELASARANPSAALSLATEPIGPAPKDRDVAELAAWTVVANVLLNLDGVLTKE